MTSATVQGTLRQPMDCAMLARIGRNTSCPLAFPAVSKPTTRPRRSTNQRFAIAAASPTIPAPEPIPTSTPQVRYSCHTWVMKALDPAPSTSSDIETSSVHFSPIVRSSAAAKGPTSPNNAIFSDTAPEMVATDQPKSRWSGNISTLGAARTPTEATMTTNITATITQA